MEITRSDRPIGAVQGSPATAGDHWQLYTTRHDDTEAEPSAHRSGRERRGQENGPRTRTGRIPCLCDGATSRALCVEGFASALRRMNGCIVPGHWLNGWMDGLEQNAEKVRGHP